LPALWARDQGEYDPKGFRAFYRGFQTKAQEVQSIWRLDSIYHDHGSHCLHQIAPPLSLRDARHDGRSGCSVGIRRKLAPGSLLGVQLRIGDDVLLFPEGPMTTPKQGFKRFECIVRTDQYAWIKLLALKLAMANGGPPDQGVVLRSIIDRYKEDNDEVKTKPKAKRKADRR
jgi:hypothetical protein